MSTVGIEATLTMIKLKIKQLLRNLLEEDTMLGILRCRS